jgi:hypothetical protein
VGRSTGLNGQCYIYIYIYIYIYTMGDNLTGGAIDGGGQRGSQYNRQRNQQHGDK